tara:strand:- start:30369 stop:31622 length:1254 start_codon:yes stop_codon:yes gene_type:complete
MKIAVLSDCHLNKSIYKGVMDKENPTLPFRSADHMKAFDWAVNDVLENKQADLIVITGDIFDSFNPSNEVRAFLYKQISKIKETKTPIIILTGNHDVCRRNHALQGISDIAGNLVKVVDNPKILAFKDHTLLLFPYPMEVERKQKTMRESFNDFVEDFHNKKEDIGDKPVIFFGHIGINGAVKSRYISAKEKDFTQHVKPFFNNDAEDVGMAELDTIGASYIFLGDYHEHQVLKTKSAYTMYAGSLEKTNMTEVNHDKGYIFYDTDHEEDRRLGKARFIKYTSCREMIDLRGNYKDIEQAYSLFSESSEGSIIRLSFIGDNKELSEFSENLDELKERIIKEINPIHIYHTQNVINAEEEETASRIEEEILSKGNVSKNEVLDVINAMLEEKDETKAEKKILFELATDVYKEATQNED